MMRGYAEKKKNFFLIFGFLFVNLCIFLLSIYSLDRNVLFLSYNREKWLFWEIAFLGFYNLFLSSIVFYFMYHFFYLKKKNFLNKKNKILKKDFSNLFSNLSFCVFIWRNIDEKPEILGSLPGLSKDVFENDFFQNLNLWLSEKDSYHLKMNLENLFEKADIFDINFETKLGHFLNVTGQISAGSVFVFFQEISQLKQKYQKQKRENFFLKQQLSLFKSILNKANFAVLLDDEEKNLFWANSFYESLFLSHHTKDRKINFFSKNSLLKFEKKKSDPFYKVPMIINGQRHFFDIYQERRRSIEGTIALDMTRFYNLKQDLDLSSKSYTEAFDLISTAVSIFDEDAKLRFANRAFASMFQFGDAFLLSKPTLREILEFLKNKGLLPQYSSWSDFKENLENSCQSTKISQHMWTLADSRSIRIFIQPQIDGSTIWIYEDLTENANLQKKYDNLIKTQGETLDYLSDGVIVLGSDGRIRLTNSSFLRLWNLPRDLAIEGVHIQKVKEFCKDFVLGSPWHDLFMIATSYDENRDVTRGHMNLKDERVFEYVTLPLPEGQILISFTDITDRFRYEKALNEKNKLLEETEKLRSNFIKHVSYELRTPLTTLIGYTQILKDSIFGVLTPKQEEFLEHIISSSADLLNVVNDILDLASVDADMLELHPSNVDLPQLISIVFSRIEEQRQQKNISIIKKIQNPLPILYADPERLRQILIKLLLNAIQQNQENSKIEISIFKEKNYIVFEIRDEFQDMNENFIKEIFYPLNSSKEAGIKSTASLMLSVAKSLVELHKGIFTIRSYGERGSVISCSFPLPENLKILKNEKK